MNYLLSINMQPPTVFDDLPKALQVVGDAIKRGYFKNVTEKSSYYTAIGPGSVIALVSEEGMKERSKDASALLDRAKGLVVQGSAKSEYPWRLVVQLRATGGVEQLDPIPFETRGAADQVAEKTVGGQTLLQVLEEGHDYLWVVPGPGVTCMVITREHMENQMRAAVRKAAQAQAAAQAAALTGSPNKRIIVAGR